MGCAGAKGYRGSSTKSVAEGIDGNEQLDIAAMVKRSYIYHKT